MSPGPGPSRVVVTRPRAKSEELARELQRQGHRVLIEPLLEIEPVPGPPPSVEGVQAMVLTSANAVVGLRGDALRLPVYAVGEATAAMARAAGCADLHVAAGDARRLAELVIDRCRPEAGALLHLSGQEVREELAERLAAAGFQLRRQVVYRAAAAASFSPALEAALRERGIDAVLFFSPRTAAIFGELARRQRLADRLDGADALCLSDAVALECRALAWRRVAVAARPEQAALLELLEGVGRRC